MGVGAVLGCQVGFLGKEWPGKVAQALPRWVKSLFSAKLQHLFLLEMKTKKQLKPASLKGS